MSRGWTHQGKHGWLLRTTDSPVFLVVRIVDDLGEPADRFINERACDPQGLGLAIFGTTPEGSLLNRLLNTIVHSVNLGKRYIAVTAQQMEDDKLHVGLKKIDCTTNVSVIDLTHVTYHFIPSIQWSIAAFQRQLSTSAEMRRSA